MDVVLKFVRLLHPLLLPSFPYLFELGSLFVFSAAPLMVESLLSLLVASYVVLPDVPLEGLPSWHQARNFRPGQGSIERYRLGLADGLLRILRVLHRLCYQY